MGLAQRQIEAAGISTIALSTVPDLTASVGVPRVAAIEHPLGRPLGEAGDRGGQLAVLRATLDALASISEPGTVVHLPFEWAEPPRRVRWHPAEPPPIAKLLKRKPWLFPRLLAREVTASG